MKHNEYNYTSAKSKTTILKKMQRNLGNLEELGHICKGKTSISSNGAKCRIMYIKRLLTNLFDFRDMLAG
jgi:hypothetical protein